jgi:inner membrane protein YhjD
LWAGGGGYLPSRDDVDARADDRPHDVSAARNGAERGGGVATALAVAVLATAVTKVAAAPAVSRESADGAAPRDGSGAAQAVTAKSGLLGRIDLYQQRKRPLAFPIGVVKRFGDDRAGQLAALIAYYGFFSLFPAMLALVTVLGFVLEGQDSLRQDIADSALAQFPVIGESISSTVDSPLTGSTIALVIGLLGALWAGLGAMQAAQDAMNSIWDVPRVNSPKFLAKRLRSLGMLVLIGLMLITSTAVSQIAVNVVPGAISTILLFVVSVGLNIGVYLVAFRVLTVAPLTWRQVRPGAVVGGIAYTVIQLVGLAYVTRTVKGAGDTYGTFAIVIGLLSWIYLIAQVTMFAAEVNVVAAKHLWPRSLFGRVGTESDRRSAASQARAEQVDERMNVNVSFGHDAGAARDSSDAGSSDDRDPVPEPGDPDRPGGIREEHVGGRAPR